MLKKVKTVTEQKLLNKTMEPPLFTPLERLQKLCLLVLYAATAFSLGRCVAGVFAKPSVGDPFDRHNAALNNARHKPHRLGLDVGVNWYSYC